MGQIVLINVTGEAPSALLAGLTGLLAQGGAQLLDLSQSSSNGAQALSVIARLPGENAALREQVRELAGDVRITDLDDAACVQWLDAQGQSRLIVTLMARQVDAGHLAQVVALLEQHGLVIARTEQLSRAHGTAGARTKSAYELTALGEPTDFEALRQACFDLSQTLDVDICLQRDSLFRRHRRLAVFDMDSTLIQAEVIDELAKTAGVGEAVSAITERAMRGELDFRASFKERMSLLKGMDTSVLDEIAAAIPLTEGAEVLFAELKRLGYKTAILSGGFTYFAHKVQARLGIDYVFANELQIVDGKLTGVAVEPIVDAQRKADLLVQLAEQEGLTLEQTIAVGDGANDLPMLGLAGLGVAFQAKPLVRKSARHAISTLGLDGVLYLLGQHDRDAKA